MSLAAAGVVAPPAAFDPAEDGVARPPPALAAAAPAGGTEKNVAPPSAGPGLWGYGDGRALAVEADEAAAVAPCA